jgi:SnoaL-like domain
MSQTKGGPTVEQLVSETDHVQLSCLVTEQAWRADNAWAETIHELYVDDGELIVGPTPLRGREAILEWGRQLVENPPWRVIRHVCGNMRFVSDGPDAAEGTTILTSSWSRDLGRRPLNPSASVRITIASFALKKDGGLSPVVGLSCSREATF